MKLTDDLLSYLLDTVSQEQFEEIIIYDCLITDKIYPKILKYIKGGNSRITKFEVEGDGFTKTRELNRILDEICEKQNTFVSYDSVTIEEESLEPENSIQSESEGTYVSEEEEMSESEDLEERKKLLEENERLRQRIQSLRDMINPSMYPSGNVPTFVVGTGVKEFMAMLADLSSRLEELVYASEIQSD